MKLLKNVIVLDLTQAYSGPFCTMHLADHGATVIKVERPGVGDQSRTWGPFKNNYSAYYAFLNRNKKGLSLNITKEKGQKILRSLVQKADVLCENFRVGTLEKYGLGYEELKKINPGLIYASISGYGLEGPLSKRPAYDIVAQAMSGIMSITGYPDAPPVKVGPSIGDNYTGAYLALGVAMGLYHRSRTGEGCRIDVAMVDTLFSVLENAVVNYTVKGEIPQRMGNIDPGIAPFDSFQAKDGMFVMGVGTDKMWKSLCELMDRPDIYENPRYQTNEQRCENYLPDLKNDVQEWTSTLPLDELEPLIVDAGIPFGRIQNVAEAAEHPQTILRNMVQTITDPVIGEMKVPGIPIKIQGSPDNIEAPAPIIGQHTEEILSEIGYSSADMKILAQEGII